MQKEGEYKEVMSKAPTKGVWLKGKNHGDRKCQLVDILKVHGQYLSNFASSFPQHVLGPNNVLRANGLIKGSSIDFLFNSGI